MYTTAYLGLKANVASYNTLASSENPSNNKLCVYNTDKNRNISTSNNIFQYKFYLI